MTRIRKATIAAWIWFILTASLTFAQTLPPAAEPAPLAIRVGVYDNAPKIWMDQASGRPQGFWPEVTRAIAEEAGWEVEWVYGEWEDLLVQLEEGGIDLLPDVAVLPSRMDRFEFIDGTYLTSWSGVYIPRDDAFSGVLDLAGSRIAVLRESSNYLGEEGIKSVLDKFGVASEFVEFTSYDDAFSAVATGKADVAITNVQFGRENAMKYGLRATSFVFNPTTLTYAMPRDGALNDRLGPILDAWLVSNNHDVGGAYVAAFERYILGETGSAEFRLTEEEEAWIAEHPIIRLGIDPGWPPYGYIGEHGEFLGIASDYVRFLNEKLGVSIIPVTGIDWAEAVERLKNGKMDMLMFVSAGVSDRPLLYTKPVLATPVTVVQKKAAAPIMELGDVNGSVAVTDASAFEDYIRRNHPSVTILPTGSLEEALIAVHQEKAAAAVDSQIAVGYEIERLDLTGFRDALIIPGGDLRIGVRKDWPELVGMLDRALDSMSDEERGVIVGRWSTPAADARIDWTIVRNVALALFLSAGAVIALMAVFNRRLNTQVKSRTRGLRESEARTKDFIEHLPVGVVITDKDGKIIDANARVLEVTRYASKEELMRLDPEKLYADPKDRDRFFAKVASGGVRDMEIQYRTKDGKGVWGSVTAIPQKDEGGSQRLIIVVEDVTERRKNRKRVEEMDKLKSSFITALTHVVRTPLTAIGWNVDTLLSGDLGKINTEQAVALQQITESRWKVANVVSDIGLVLDIKSGAWRPNRRPVSLSRLVKTVAEGLKEPFARKKIAFTVKAPGKGDLVNVDADKIRRVLEILMGNALAYTPEGGSVNVIVQQTPGDVTVKVSDTGIGISELDDVYTYDLFWRGSNSAKMYPDGVGIGLFLAKSIIEKHGGGITHLSKENKGTSFTFSIPKVVKGGK